MSNRILCPFHEEGTPSCVIYSDHFRCYGCGEYGPLSRLSGKNVRIPEGHDPEPEDLEASFRYIESLPFKKIRGLLLRADDRAYYITWPHEGYYKKRFFKDTGGPKYIGAAGHKKPPYWGTRRLSDTLIIVEGELNAMSIGHATDFDVMSPGGVGDFSAQRAKLYLQSTADYSTILIVADKDAPGAQAVIELLGVLRGRGQRVGAKLMAPDANDVLVQEGPEALRKFICDAVEEVSKKA